MKKRLFTILLCLIISFVVVYKLDFIVNYLAKYFKNTPDVAIEEKNRFSKNRDYEFVQISKDYVPYSYQDLLNIFYTILDSGYDTFTFYCPSEYIDCLSDVEKISNKENIEILTTIGNFVSPYNNFSSMKVQYDTAGEVTVDITHLYTEEDILNITNKIDEIWKSVVTKDMKNEDIIYAFHDYIINKTRYDVKYEKEVETGKTTHQSAKANGPLFEGYGICSGYTDAMAIVLDKIGVPNFKVASNTHVWNALYINNKWVHLDLTWDDPCDDPEGGCKKIDYLLHKFFLIDTPSLEEFDIKDHTFNKSIYLELDN